MRKTILATLSLLSAVAGAGPNPPGNPLAPAPSGKVDLVIALDTSSSMDGLIDSAREKLWDVVGLLNQAHPRPVLRVGLVSYGNDGYRAADGWVRKESDLTTDLDSVYSKLFGLRTNGGEEYVARAVDDATRQMQWDQDPHTLKMIFVAGNEPANQDPQIPVEAAVQRAREKGIFVNAIYCGGEHAGEAGGWRTVAALGRGRFAAIDQDHVLAVSTPMDADLDKLSSELNNTYVGYGALAKEKAANQVQQDVNARSTSPSAAAGRASAKATAMYHNDDWDLVDALRDGKKDVARLPTAELPPAMQKMTVEQRKAYVDKMAKRREELQKQIAQKSAERDKYLAGERAKRAQAGTKALDEALGDTIKAEAAPMGYSFH